MDAQGRRVHAANRLVVLSNRGAHALKVTEQGLVRVHAVGGLVTAVEPILERYGGVWISWHGRTAPLDGPRLPSAPAADLGYEAEEVLLSEAEYHSYYTGFANGCLWPLLHNFPGRCRFLSPQWQAYRAVNARFAAQAARRVRADSLVWVHDFHLSLVPALVREQAGPVPIALFWHVPFPPPETFEVLPWGRELLSGMLGSDHIAFHVPAYAANFLACVRDRLGALVDPEAGMIAWQGRRVQVEALPLGVDVPAFRAVAHQPEVRHQAETLRQAVGERVLLLGIDRLDYTKGIPERLEAFEHLLETQPHLHGQVTLLQVGVPSRSDVLDYRELRERIEALVGRINGRFGTARYQPVLYSTRPLARAELVAHYLAADVCLVTPLRDGLNLVAKEYVSSRTDQRGALVLSRFAGAAADLPEALLVNPYLKEELAAAIGQAIAMPPARQRQRLAAMQARLAERDLTWWWQQVQATLHAISARSAAATAGTKAT